MAQFQNDKLKAIEEKLEDKPTKEEIEKMIQKLSEFGFAVLSAKLDEMKNEVLSELKGKFFDNDIYWYAVSYLLMVPGYRNVILILSPPKLTLDQKTLRFPCYKFPFKMTHYYQILWWSSCIYRVRSNIS